MTDPQWFRELDAGMRRAASFGHEVEPSGTENFGRVPHVAPQAWLHIRFAGATDKNLRYGHYLGRGIPGAYRDFLKLANGLWLFSGSLALNGVGGAGSLPFDLVYHNVDDWERPGDAEPWHFFIGSYSDDASLLYLDEKEGRVHRSERDSVAPLNSWSAFPAMVTAEFKRLEALFDDTGRQRHVGGPTTPAPD